MTPNPSVINASAPNMSGGLKVAGRMMLDCTRTYLTTFNDASAAALTPEADLNFDWREVPDSYAMSSLTRLSHT